MFFMSDKVCTVAREIDVCAFKNGNKKQWNYLLFLVSYIKVHHIHAHYVCLLFPILFVSYFVNLNFFLDYLRPVRSTISFIVIREQSISQKFLNNLFSYVPSIGDP
jgi:hypothetical protein